MAVLFDMVHAKWTAASSVLTPLIRRSLAMAAVWLVIVNLFALLAFNRLNLAPDTAFEWMSPGTYKVKQSWDIISLHNRWDSYWYLDIAQNGYYLRGEAISNVVFFPLYPLLVRLTGPFAGGDLVLAGWMLSSLFLLLTVAMATRLSQEFHPGIDPTLPAAFLLAYPAAFFLNAVYSESLFLFLSLATVFWALRRNFMIASIFAALASATRVAGVFLFVILFVEFVQSNGWRALVTRRVWPLALAPFGALAFCLYHWIAFDDFFLYFKVQRAFGRDFEMEAGDFLARNGPDLANKMLDLAYTAVAILLGVVALRRLRPSYGVYMLVSLGIALSSGTTLGIARYSMVLFPIYFIAAGIRSPVGRGAWFFGSTLLLALDIIRFVNHYWTS
ncbi:MAG TPA: mannosyltransferase family protein [Desulfobacterales bacterium]|nr:mannosyltransferase family protein [Desulfobacterales bacterium]